MTTKQRDKFIAKTIVKNMTEEQKSHIYRLMVSHMDAVGRFRSGELDFYPGIQISFVQISEVCLTGPTRKRWIPKMAEHPPMEQQ